MADVERIDRYLWSVRLFKTRSEATEACKGNKVKIGGVNAKPSRLIKLGDVIEVRKGAIVYTYKVKALLQNRVGAALVQNYAENLTPQSELDKLGAPKETVSLKRDRGTGRPTKKERRDMTSVMEGIGGGGDEFEIPEELASRFGITGEDEF